MKRGKLIVIDGGDGSGKATQTKLLVNYVSSKKIPVKTISFPRYETFYGKLVGRFLTGEFGKLNEVSPYLAALPYALDRADARDEIEQWLDAGNLVIADRYTTSSIAHQAAKFPEYTRDELISWIKALEYKQNKLPRPDLVVYLYVPWQIGVTLTNKQVTKRTYSKKPDIAEKDVQHREKSEQVYRHLAKTEPSWVEISCIDEKGTLLTPVEVHKKVVAIISNAFLRK